MLGPVPASTLAASRGTNLAYQHKKSGIPQRYARLQPSITTHLEENSLLVSHVASSRHRRNIRSIDPVHRTRFSPYLHTVELLDVYSRSRANRFCCSEAWLTMLPIRGRSSAREPALRMAFHSGEQGRGPAAGRSASCGCERTGLRRPGSAAGSGAGRGHAVDARVSFLGFRR
jgi:hypothetical protein